MTDVSDKLLDIIARLQTTSSDPKWLNDDLEELLTLVDAGTDGTPANTLNVDVTKIAGVIVSAKTFFMAHMMAAMIETSGADHNADPVDTDRDRIKTMARWARIYTEAAVWASKNTAPSEEESTNGDV